MITNGQREALKKAILIVESVADDQLIESGGLHTGETNSSIDELNAVINVLSGLLGRK